MMEEAEIEFHLDSLQKLFPTLPRTSQVEGPPWYGADSVHGFQAVAVGDVLICASEVNIAEARVVNGIVGRVKQASDPTPSGQRIRLTSAVSDSLHTFAIPESPDILVHLCRKPGESCASTSDAYTTHCDIYGKCISCDEILGNPFVLRRLPAYVAPPVQDASAAANNNNPEASGAFGAKKKVARSAGTPKKEEDQGLDEQTAEKSSAVLEAMGLSPGSLIDKIADKVSEKLFDPAELRDKGPRARIPGKVKNKTVNKDDPVDLTSTLAGKATVPLDPHLRLSGKTSDRSDETNSEAEALQDAAGLEVVPAGEKNKNR